MEVEQCNILTKELERGNVRCGDDDIYCARLCKRESYLHFMKMSPLSMTN